VGGFSCAKICAHASVVQGSNQLTADLRQEKNTYSNSFKDIN
jgi:hypothetical protein